MNNNCPTDVQREAIFQNDQLISLLKKITKDGCEISHSLWDFSRSINIDKSDSGKIDIFTEDLDVVFKFKDVLIFKLNAYDFSLNNTGLIIYDHSNSLKNSVEYLIKPQSNMKTSIKQSHTIPKHWLEKPIRLWTVFLKDAEEENIISEITSSLGQDNIYHSYSSDGFVLDVYISEYDMQTIHQLNRHKAF